MKVMHSAAMNIFMVSCWDHTNNVHSESENQVLLILTFPVVLYLCSLCMWLVASYNNYF